jgi:tRNA nucleotidyltransferase (CCA-adding enzyme)
LKRRKGEARRKLPERPDLRRLAAGPRRSVAAARRVAREEGRALYLVGGPVRDLFLGRRPIDVDVVVEGDAQAFARRLAQALGVQARVHERFGTATLPLPGDGRLDVARSRRETYAAPGALPRVEPAPIAEDLGRRDFTINAMALELSPGRRLLDPFGGKADLERRVVRMLHAGSAVDDPTRAFRAARYANRLGFRVEPATRLWIARAARDRAFDSVSGDRLRRELKLIFAEENRAGAARLLRDLGLDAAIDPALRSDAAVFRRLRRAETVARRHPEETSWLLYLLVWTCGLDRDAVERLTRRFALSGEDARRLRSWPEVFGSLAAGEPEESRSRILARGLSGDELAATAAAVAGAAGRRLERALAARPIRLAISGKDLLAAGVPSGRRIGEALAAALAARRDGRISRRRELAFAVAAARGEPS